MGHLEVLGPSTPLRAAIEAGAVGSLILWGPPGVGKTSVAFMIAVRLQAQVERLSAVSAGVRDLRGVIARAALRHAQGKRTVLIVDEIHRFNKAQQDVLLPAVEEGEVTLIGATTENPYFEVIKALVSRVEVVRMQALTEGDVGMIIDRALEGVTASAGKTPGASPPPPGIYAAAGSTIWLTDAGRAALVTLAGGDARRALNVLELLLSAHPSGGITGDMAQAAGRQAAVQYDRAGDVHYDTISAFIKSMRGSDPDAALFYLFRMLVAGEDPRFIVRRMFIFASEDIGNADPHSLMLAAAASQALEWVGLPEAEYALAHAATYLASAPKSNRVTVAMNRAKTDVARHGNAAPPDWVTNVEVKFKGHGPDFPVGIVQQQYRPDAVQGNIYYEPGTEGFEKEVKRRVERARQAFNGGTLVTEPSAG